MMQGIGQKIAEWAVIAALVGVIGYLIGNSDAMTMKAQIDRNADTLVRHEREIESLERRWESIAPRIERLDALSEMERRKGSE